MKIKSLLLALLAVAVFAVSAGADKAVQLKESKTTYAAEAVKPYIESGELPGIINVFSKDNLLEVTCAGWADVEKKVPMSLDKMFMQCSQTKGFCGVTIAILVEEGKISLDDPVSKYLPEFKTLYVGVKDKNKKTVKVPAKNVLTIRMVMNHTGGFPCEIPTKQKKGWPGLALRETAKEAASRPLLFEPGTQYKYSNTGIDIGAAIVEVVTGQPWDIFLKERVLDKLGMKDSTFNPTEEQLSRAISMYNIKEGKKAQFRLFHPYFPLPHNGSQIHPFAGGGLWTTATDQLKFYRMLMNLGVGDNGVRILKEETVKSLLATSTRPEKLGKYSLGLQADFKNGTMGHGGAFGTSATVNWKNKTLILKVVQVRGKNKALNASLKKAADKFFLKKIDTSGTDAYTGRVK